MSPREIILFGGPHCGLCERALDLLSPCLGPADQLRLCDVTTRLEWKKRYGLAIPVLRREDSGAELFWPFDEAAIRNFLAEPT